VAAVIAIVGFTIAILFNPLWVGFEQERSGVPAITGYTSEVRAVTGWTLTDLFLGPPDFDVAVDEQPALDAAERSHMADVRSVLLPAAIGFGAAIAVPVALLATSRQRAWLWRAIGLGSGALTLAGIVVGVWRCSSSTTPRSRCSIWSSSRRGTSRSIHAPSCSRSCSPTSSGRRRRLPSPLPRLAIATAVTIVAWRRAARLGA